MFSPDVMNLLLGTVVGGILKIIAAKMKKDEHTVNLLAQRQGLADDSADRAAQRGGEWGAWTRRVIALTVVGYLFVAPVVIVLANMWVRVINAEIGLTPLIYAYSEASGGWWIFSNPDQMKFIEVDGLTVLPFQRQLATMIAGFYFGAGIVK